jgi:spermidine/putrescine transport system substrate-binding protein
MKWNGLRGGVAGLVVALAAGCGPARPTLHVYTWADYIKPELVARFEKEHACRVVLDTFDSNESMYAKLKAGAAGYDVVIPTGYMVSLMEAQGMLLPVDRGQVPNLAHVDPRFLSLTEDGECRHSVPYMVSFSGIAYRKSKIADFEPTWAMFDRPALSGRVTMLNDMREVMGAALKFLGYSINSVDEKELAAARDVALRWKKHLAKYENEQYKNGIASGEFLMVHGYNSDIRQVMEENKDIAYATPREGFVLSCDELVILKNAPQPGLAHAFINFLHDPQVAAENTSFVFCLCPNRESYALLGDELKNDPTIMPAEDVLAKAEVIRDLGADNAKYVRIWDQIKGGAAE